MKKKKKLESMWTVGTGGAEVPMINITSNQKPWKGSSDTIDDRITTAVVVEQSTVRLLDQSRILHSRKTRNIFFNINAKKKKKTKCIQSNDTRIPRDR